jgi:hypothetical protein
MLSTCNVVVVVKQLLRDKQLRHTVHKDMFMLVTTCIFIQHPAVECAELVTEKDNKNGRREGA